MDAMQLDLFGNQAAPPPPTVRVHQTEKVYERKRPQPRPKSGKELKKEALDEHERKGADWLRQARRYALEKAAANGLVSADDIDIPLPTWAHPSLRGSIFRVKWFTRVGFINSTRPVQHAALIAQYQLSYEGRQALKEKPPETGG